MINNAIKSLCFFSFAMKNTFYGFTYPFLTFYPNCLNWPNKNINFPIKSFEFIKYTYIFLREGEVTDI